MLTIIMIVGGWIIVGLMVDTLMRYNNDYVDAMIDTFHINYPLYLVVKWLIVLLWPLFVLWLLAVLCFRRGS